MTRILPTLLFLLLASSAAWADASQHVIKDAPQYPADARAAIQAGINTAKDGQAVVLAPGRYRLSGSLRLRPGQTFSGSGMLTTEIVACRADGSPNNQVPFFFENGDGCTFSDLTIDVPASINFTRCITVRKRAHGLTITRMRFTNSNYKKADPFWTVHGIDIRSDVKDLSVTHCIFDRVQAKVEGNVRNFTFAHNQSQHSNQMGVSCIIGRTQLGEKIQGVHIYENEFVGWDDMAIYIGVDGNDPADFSQGSHVRDVFIYKNQMLDGGPNHKKPFPSRGILLRAWNGENLNITDNIITTKTPNLFSEGIRVTPLYKAHRIKRIRIERNQFEGWTRDLFVEKAIDVRINSNDGVRRCQIFDVTELGVN